jgi:ATP-dependent Lhr-like helicase
MQHSNEDSEQRAANSEQPLHSSQLSIWGISATIGNLNEASDVLMASLSNRQGFQPVLVKASIRKEVDVESVIPDEIEKYPWAGHLGIKLVDKVIPIITNSRTTLIFINTRGMSELWYQAFTYSCTGSWRCNRTASWFSRYGTAFLGRRKSSYR